MISFRSEAHGVPDWQELRPHELPAWSHRLVEVREASIRQYPLFYERFRGPLLRPHYLVLGGRDEPHAFLAMLGVGVPGMWCGVVWDGPVVLDASWDPPSALGALRRWALRRAYAFIRFTHLDEGMAGLLATVGQVERADSFPMAMSYAHELYVRIDAEDDVLLSRFQEVARRDIRKAVKNGCVISRSLRYEDFEALWPIFEEQSRSKAIRYRRLESYHSFFRESPRETCVRIYWASYQGRPVHVAVVLRDGTTGHYFIGAMDRQVLGLLPSPSCLLHWEAMKDARNEGCVYYNLGGSSGSYSIFKTKFRPFEWPAPLPVTWVLHPLLYRAWMSAALPSADMLKAVAGHLVRSQSRR